MSRDHSELLNIPHTSDEHEWLEERLYTLSARESVVLAAAREQTPPETAKDAINIMASLRNYGICGPASDCGDLGWLYLAETKLALPDMVIAYTDMDALGAAFADMHPGSFIGNFYVMYPDTPAEKPYDGTNLATLKDDDWSVRVKLASAQRTDGVWLRLPDYELTNAGSPGECEMTLHELGVESFHACKILDARCILPEVGNLMEQYDDAAELVIDGNNLGYLLDERAQGMKSYGRKLAAAMEYEGCATLKEVIACAEGIRKYSFVTTDKLEDYARSELLKAGAPEALIDGGVFDMEGFAKEFLEENGYLLDGTGNIYLKFRQEQELTQGEMTMQQM